MYQKGRNLLGINLSRCHWILGEIERSNNANGEKWRWASSCDEQALYICSTYNIRWIPLHPGCDIQGSVENNNFSTHAMVAFDDSDRFNWRIPRRNHTNNNLSTHPMVAVDDNDRFNWRIPRRNHTNNNLSTHPMVAVDDNDRFNWRIPRRNRTNNNLSTHPMVAVDDNDRFNWRIPRRNHTNNN